MAKTVFITGTSSGIGRATALHFAAQGWKVAATMRSPDRHSHFSHLANVNTYSLDVTDSDSISHAIAEALHDFGQVDVLVNNAGLSVFGAFECATDQEIQKQLNTNLLGVMNVTRGMLPHFRQRRSGRIITVTSVGGLVSYPLFTLYHASKWGVEGFMESLHFELKPFNIRVKLIEPGAVDTLLTDNAVVSSCRSTGDYNEYVDRVQGIIETSDTSRYTKPIEVAKMIMRAATDSGNRMRYPVGNGKVVLRARRLLPLSWFHRMIGSVR